MANDPAHIKSLATLSKSFDLKSRETPREMESRLGRAELDAQHERKKDLMILWAVILIVCLASLVCVVVIFLPHSSAESVKFLPAESSLSSAHRY